MLTVWAYITMSAQDSLRIRLDSLLSNPLFETTQVGLMVYDLTADSVYYQRNARQLLRPASTMTLAPEMLGHLTGMPNHESLEPQRPGPTST